MIQLWRKQTMNCWTHGSVLTCFCSLFHWKFCRKSLYLTKNSLFKKPLWFEPRLGHMWESQVLLTDGQVVFLRVLRFSPTLDERSARYKWNILERAVKPKSKKTKQKKNLYLQKTLLGSLHRFRSVCASVQSDLNILCLLTYATVSINSVSRSS